MRRVTLQTIHIHAMNPSATIGIGTPMVEDSFVYPSPQEPSRGRRCIKCHRRVVGRTRTHEAVKLGFSPPVLIQQVTGPNPGFIPSGNARYGTNTAKYGVGAADLGCMWDNRDGTTFHVFGDNFKICTPAFDGPTGEDWQPNALGRSSNIDLINGIRFDDFNVGSDGDRIPIIPLFDDEDGLVPTGGINVNGKDYLSYVVFAKDHTDQSQTSVGGTAMSKDSGRTWRRERGCSWKQNIALTDPFQQSTFASSGDGYVYRFTTESNRAGNIHLLRVPEAGIIEKARYQYWTGTAWVSDEKRVGVLIKGPVGEMSARYDDLLEVFYIMYHDDSQQTTVFQYAATPTGPWSAKLPIMPDSQFDIYAPMIHPRSSGTDLFFCGSMWDTYETCLFYAKLRVSR
jgi:D-arabinan endo alpha-(1,5)-arabinofuranosidase